MKNLAAKLTILFLFILVLGNSQTAVLAAVAAPTNVAASNGLWANFVKINWDSGATAGNHAIYRSETEASGYTQVDTVPSDQHYYNDTSAVTGTHYYYKVKTCVDITCSTLSDSDLGWRGYINVVTSVSATYEASPDYTFIAWGVVTGATYYEVLRTQDHVGFLVVDTTTTASYFDTTVSPANPYYYYVKACNATHCSQFGGYDQGKRSWPVVQNVTASDGGYANQVLVTWDEIIGAVDYQVRYRRTGLSTWEGPLSTFVEQRYVDLPRVATDYDFSVTPCWFDDCNPEWSAIDIGWADFDAPSWVDAADGTSTTEIEITWGEVAQDPSLGEAFYFVLRDEYLTPSGAVHIGEKDNLELFYDDYANYGALPGKAYNYTIVACPYNASSYTAKGCSEPSSPNHGYFVPEAASNLTASDGTYSTYVEVTWDAVPLAAGYLVRRSMDPYDSFPAWITLDTVTTNSYQDTSAQEGFQYYYGVWAGGPDQYGAVSNFDPGYRDPVCHPLTLESAGKGTIVPNPTESYACLEGEYVEGYYIGLTAEPDKGWLFESWTNTNNDSITENSNMLTMPGGAHTVYATFIQDLIFVDDFETNDLSQWTRFNDGSGFMNACTAGKISGSYGACVTRGSNDKRKQLIDDTPANETSFSARFNFDINNLSMTTGERFRFMQFKWVQERPAFIVLKYDSGVYSIQLNALLDDLTKVKTGWVTLPDAPTTIEVEWEQSSGANDGFANLYLDGVLLDGLSGLDNDTINITSFRMGFTSKLGGKSISGTFYIDDVATSNGGYIGLP